MQPVKLTIHGEFWDSHIYSSQLHLFGMDSSVTTIDWNRLVSSLNVGDDLVFALQCAFTNSEWLYGPKFKILFRDREIRDLIRSKFDRLSAISLTADRNLLANSRVKKHAFNHPFPFTDLTIYKQHVYSSSLEGICFDRLTAGKRIPLSNNPNRLWDCPTLSIAASFSNLATATGTEGLHKVPLYGEDGLHSTREKAQMLADEDCVHCNWLETGIYGSSHTGRSCFADFEVEARRVSEKSNGDIQRAMLADTYTGTGDHIDSPYSRTKLNLKNTIYSDKIFEHIGYSWGSYDKLYLTHKNKIKVVKVQSRTIRRDLDFHAIEDVGINLKFGNVVSGAVAPFGTVIECDEGIVLLNSDGIVSEFAGEPVRYRVFNRSRHYENQLHIIYDDRIEIYSFNGDYFVDQSKKVFGYTAFV